MKRMLFLGVLALSATVCSQSYGFELLDRMLGHHGCADSCCEPACDAGAGCCEPGCDAAGCCEPACDAGVACCEPACDAGVACCEPACDAGCTSCCDRPCHKKHNLFGGLKSLFAKCKAKHHGCCDSCCEPACDAGNGCCEPGCDAAGCCEPACDAGNGCCEPACDAGVACCEPACDAGCTSCCDTGCHKHHRPFLGFFKALHSAKKRCHSCTDSCCEPACDAGMGCCEPACDAGNGCCEPGCAAGGCCEPACGAYTVEPAMAPVPDASASTSMTNRLFAAFSK